MLIKLKDIIPNHFRNLEVCPIDRDKVGHLKHSIKETSFWRNIICRAIEENKFELAYGYHRYTALKELRVKEIDIPVMELSDAQMIKIMANENLEVWGSKPLITMESIRVAYEYLSKKLEESANAPEFRSVTNIEIKARRFDQLKDEGIGSPTVLKFLGKPWSKHIVETTLAQIKAVDEGIIDEQDLSDVAESVGNTAVPAVVELAKTYKKKDNLEPAQVKKKIKKFVKTVTKEKKADHKSLRDDVRKAVKAKKDNNATDPNLMIKRQHKKQSAEVQKKKKEKRQKPINIFALEAFKEIKEAIKNKLRPLIDNMDYITDMPTRDYIIEQLDDLIDVASKLRTELNDEGANNHNNDGGKVLSIERR